MKNLEITDREAMREIVLKALSKEEWTNQQALELTLAIAYLKKQIEIVQNQLNEINEKLDKQRVDIKNGHPDKTNKMQEIEKRFGKPIKQLFDERKGKSVREIADELGISKSTVSNWEKRSNV